MDAWITGLGMISAYGAGSGLHWRSALEGRDGLRPISRFDASRYRNVLGGEVPDGPEVDHWLTRGHRRSTAYALAAAREAIEQAGFPASATPKIGICLGTNFGAMRSGEAAFSQRLARPDAAADFSDFWPGSALTAMRLALRGDGGGDGGGDGDDNDGGGGGGEKPEAGGGQKPPEAVVSLSCASGAAALGVALGWLRAGRAEAVLAGGFDELSETAVAGLSALRAISRHTVRPCDAERDGTIFAEGAGVLLLETPDSAARRGAAPLARLIGAAMNNDAFHMTAPDQTAAGMAQVMRMALANANAEPADIDHVNLHGTGTPYNDSLEAKAMHAVFGSRVPQMRFTANKSLIGHAMGAAGALEAAFTVLSLREGRIPPTLRLKTPDPELRIPIVSGRPLDFRMRAALSNSYGLGGTNACVAIRAV